MSQLPPNVALPSELAAIQTEINAINATENTVYFLDNQGKELAQGRADSFLDVPPSTEKIVANGDLKLGGDMPNTVKSVFASGKVNILGDSQGKIVAAGNVIVVGTAHDNITSHGTVKCRAVAKKTPPVNIKGTEVQISEGYAPETAQGSPVSDSGFGHSAKRALEKLANASFMR
jgi:hypothetical protein